MKFYVYFDAYGHAKQIITEQQLAETFHSETNEFLVAMCQGQPNAAGTHCSGHVGTLTFDNEEDLQDYLDYSLALSGRRILSLRLTSTFFSPKLSRRPTLSFVALR